MLDEKITRSAAMPPASDQCTEEKPLRQESVITRLLRSAWQQHRLLTALAVIVFFALFTIMIQNPMWTTVDLLLWTVTLRQGMGLALMFLIGWACGWVTHILYHWDRFGN